MTRNELTIVLLKLIGFYLAAAAILNLPQNIITYGTLLISSTNGPNSLITWQVWSVFIGVAVHIIGGILIIIKSHDITKWLLTLGNKKSKIHE
jgi:hypothetical protein